MNTDDPRYIAVNIVDALVPTALTSRAEFSVDRPAQAVWNILIDMNYEIIKKWNPTVTGTKHISGEPGKAGHLVSVTKSERVGEKSGGTHYMKTITAIPLKQRVLLLTFPQNNNISFVEHSLYESNGKTKVVYSSYQICYVEPAQLDTFRENLNKEAKPYQDKGMALLKELIENEYPI